MIRFAPGPRYAHHAHAAHAAHTTTRSRARDTCTRSIVLRDRHRWQCTCRAGRDDDCGAVLDAHMRVRGTARLRVADASAMPEIVGANTNATCIALGEKVADLVAREHEPVRHAQCA